MPNSLLSSHFKFVRAPPQRYTVGLTADTLRRRDIGRGTTSDTPESNESCDLGFVIA